MSIQGFEEFESNLEKLAMKNKLAANQALRHASFIFEEILQRKTPIGEGIPAGHELATYKELAKSIVKTGLKKDRDEGSLVDIGFNKSQGWRAHFPDSGTMNQTAQHFIEAARKEARPKIIAIFEAEIRKGL
ncbi:hypothetical protein IIE63_000771 [Listeria monocytogenes]|uniref:HK97 gp10 family phage protein n=1 Tax=Listeria monocytogenes TaxID=1639 RepID=A0A823IZP6_LISMN|nr:HK97-gp10 family putative phage morphogenesis protein [Listeria monocytogenes]EAG9223057.1 hypothetical protein [Listeria monocytogenes]EAG9354862.1 hypothetical protein [Listeria monocytogenes]EGN0214402.1 hypothetical protein [Listeria monocytogenes]OET20144.1 hypothetical protein AJL11_03260 [Listeria monocytogenes]OFG93511.1 hypothetical protein BJM83_06885 [Listeria monocytogenes]